MVFRVFIRSSALFISSSIVSPCDMPQTNTATPKKAQKIPGEAFKRLNFRSFFSKTKLAVPETPHLNKMAPRTKTRYISIVDKRGTFNTLFKKFEGEKKDYSFEGISVLRRILSNEKARLMHIIKIKKPTSIYNLAKILGRDFKSVNDDIKLLEEFGFLDLISEKTGLRNRLRPILIVDTLNINLKI